jgi:hypothetical protein
MNLRVILMNAIPSEKQESMLSDESDYIHSEFVD